MLITIAVSLGVINYYNNNFNNEQLAALAQQTATFDNVFAQALNAYVTANSGTDISGVVSCSALKSAGFLSSFYSCSDPVGEQLAGYVSEPWGFPQTWLISPSSLPDANILAKFGIKNALQWKEFTLLVAQDSMNGQPSFQSFGISAGNSFTFPQSGYTDNLANYFPAGNVEFPQTVPSVSYYDGYSFIISPNIQLNPSYWLFYVLMTDAPGNASITYQNMGYSPVCPPDSNGNHSLIPGGAEQYADSNWQFLAGYSRGDISGANYFGDIEDGLFGSSFDGFYLCVPTAKSNITTGASKFSNSTVTSMNYAADQLARNGAYYDGSSNTLSVNSAEQQIPQNNNIFYINDGFAVYTLLITEGLVNSNNGGADIYYDGAVLWFGRPSNPSTLDGMCVISALPGFELPKPPCWSVAADAGLPQSVNF